MKPEIVTANNIIIPLSDHARIPDVGRKVEYMGLTHYKGSKVLMISVRISHFLKSNVSIDITGDLPDRQRTLTASDRNFIQLSDFSDYTPEFGEDGLPIIPETVISEYDFWMNILENQNALIFDKIYDAIALRASQGLFDN